MTGVQDLLERLKDEPRDLFSRVVALCAVMTTLIAANVAFLHANASREGDRAAAAAQRIAIEAAHNVVKRRQIAQLELTRLELGREYRARELNALQPQLLGLDDSSLEIEAAHWRGLADRANRQLHRSASKLRTLDISLGGRASPERDPLFPTRLLAQTERRGVYLAALRDARSELSSEWGKRAAIFIAILTLLAVALYLFGFSLTPQGRHMRGVFATFGAVFLIIGVIFGPIQACFPPTAAPDEAAVRYADGKLGIMTASDRSDYAAAVEAFDETIRLRPGFARAYVDRASARIAAASPQASIFLSLAPPDVREAGIRDLRKARELGLDTPSVIGDLGFELLALGLQTGRDGYVDESIELTEEAIRAEPHEPVLRFNLGAALLAAGRQPEARRAYRAALREVLPRSQGRSPEDVVRADSLRAGWISGALTDLEMVARHRGIEFVDDIRSIKELIIGSDDRNRLGPPPSKGSLADVSLSAGPGYLQVRVRGGKHLPLKGAWLATHWYRREPGLGWSHLESVSGPCVNEAAFVNCDLVAQHDGTYAGFVTYPDNTFPPRCLPAGDYRVELYDGARIVGEARGKNAEKGLVGFQDKDTGVVGCRPRRWTESRLRRGLVRGYVSDEGGSGLYVARLNNLVGPRSHPRRAGTYAIERLLELLPPALRSELRFAGAERFNFMELDPRSQVLRHYRYGRGHLMVGAGQDTDRSVVVGLAFGSPRAYRKGRLHEMLAALAPGYENPSAFGALASSEATQ